MKKIMLTVAVMLCLMITSPLMSETKKTTAKLKAGSCTACHADSSSVLPKDHKPVTGTGIAACSGCHKPDASGKAEPRAFSARIHRAHAKEGSKVDCTACHVWAGKRLGLPGTKVSFGPIAKKDVPMVKKVFASWSGSAYLDAAHGQANVACLACHGPSVPTTGDTVENDRCLSCHGTMEALAAKSAPKDFPDRNPHKSHLGEIACTVCHHAHAASTVYCLGCHAKFTMKISGSE